MAVPSATCRRCGAAVTWARTEATGRSIAIVAAKVGDHHRYSPAIDGQPLPEGDGNLVLTGGRRETATGLAPIVRYVRVGSGTHVEHACG
jgi:hypothetical protein